MSAEPARARCDVLLFGRYFCDLVFTGLPEVPRLSADLFASGFDMVAGGPFNTALAFKRLGLRAGWSCDFGTDLFSQFVLAAAHREGLETDLFRHHTQPLRSVSASFSFAKDRGFVSYVDPLDEAEPAQVVRRARPRAVLLSSLLTGKRHLDLVEAARDAGALIFMDCQAHGSRLDDPGVREALRTVDVFAPNLQEARALTGDRSVKTALKRLAELTPTVIIKQCA
jgi:sugar/nucleoside kinase (ribokinase family)